MELIINKKDISFFLKSIFLNGLIKEAFFIIKDDFLTVKCIDEFSILFLTSKIKYEKSLEKEFEFGIRDIQLLQKIINDLVLEDQIKFVFTESKLSINKNKIKITLPEKTEIKTYFKSEDKLKALLSQYKDKIEIPVKEFGELKQYLNIFFPANLKIFIKDNELYFASPDKEANQFCLKISDCKLDDLEVLIHTKYFLNILNFIMENAKNNTIKLGIMQEIPLYISFDNSEWLLSPM